MVLKAKLDKAESIRIAKLMAKSREELKDYLKEGERSIVITEKELKTRID